MSPSTRSRPYWPRSWVGSRWEPGFLGHVCDRVANPLKFYGLLEIGIGVTAVVGMLVLQALDPLHVRAANYFDPRAPALLAIRMLLAALVILPPTFLMGGTLPVLVRCLSRGLDRLGRELSTLYALNTLGAVTGVIAAGFLLIGSFGLHRTLWIAVAVNLAIGIAALHMALTIAPDGAKPRQRAQQTPSAEAAAVAAIDHSQSADPRTVPATGTLQASRSLSPVRPLPRASPLQPVFRSS